VRRHLRFLGFSLGILAAAYVIRTGLAIGLAATELDQEPTS
jgi:hypothetical protein